MAEQDQDTQHRPGPDGTGQPPDAAGGGEQPEGEAERTFTQADLDRIIKERMARERNKYADYADLKAQAEKWAEHEAAQQSELEKAQTRAEKAEAERAKAIEEANARLMRAAFMAEAAKVGAAHPEDAFMLADLSEVSISDDGAVSGAEEAVTALVEAGRLVLSGKPRAPGLDGGAGSGQRSTGDQVALSEAELKQAQKLGVTPEEYAKQKRKSGGNK